MRAIIIGSGFGGRASVLKAKGFLFDMGPSWWLMPDIFERFFDDLGEDISRYITLTKLAPSYRVFFKDYGQQIDIVEDLQANMATFDAIEPGAGERLRTYLDQSTHLYETATQHFLYRSYDRWRDLLTWDFMRELPTIKPFTMMDRHVAKYFHDPRLQQIMQYPLVFLGASPYNGPATYSMLSHADFCQGVFYPMGGVTTLVTALTKIARKHGVLFKTNTAVRDIIVEDGQAVGVRTAKGKTLRADIVVSDAEIHHTETELLAPQYRDHSARYWTKRTLAPSALMMYLGANRQYDSLLHHNLLFSKNWRQNFAEIFDNPQFPTDPSIYVSATSKTDPAAAPKGCENIVVLVPIAANLEYSDKQLETFADRIMQTMEQEMALPDLRKHLVYKKLFCVKDFAARYNSQGGTGLGLAHTLMQTAIFRPHGKSKKVKNLYYVGASVHPGIGVPTTLISAQLLLRRLYCR